MTEILKLLSSINKNDLEKAVSQANLIMNSENKEQIINELKKNLN